MTAALSQFSAYKKQYFVQKWLNFQERKALLWKWFFRATFTFWDMVDFCMVQCKIDYISKTKSHTKKCSNQQIIFRAMRIFPENLDNFEQKNNIFFLLKKIGEIFANLIQTLTSEAKVLNPKAFRVWRGANLLHKNGGLGGQNPLNIKKISYFSVQNRPYLKN